MNLKSRFIIFSLLAVGTLALIMISMSIGAFQDEVNHLTTTIYRERINKLIYEAREHDNMYFEGIYKNESEPKEKLIDYMRIYYRENLGTEIYPFIITTSGKIVVHPFLPSNNRTISFPKVVEAITTKNKGEVYYNFRGQKNWIVFAAFQPWNWVFIYTVPVDIKNKAVNNIRNNLIAIVIISLLIMACLIYLYIEKSFRPLEDLVDFTNSLTKGNFRQIKHIDFRDDEIGKLVNTFNNMSEELQEYIDNLHDEVNTRKKAERDVAFQKAVIESGQEASIDGIIYTTTDGSVVSFNQTILSITEMPEEIITDGKEESFVDFLLDKTSNKKLLRKCLKEIGINNRHISHEVINLESGKIVDFYTAPIISEDDEVFGRGWYLRDITVHKKAEMERDMLLENLEAKNEELESIIYVTSHDLRSPLVNMHGFSNEIKLLCKDLLDLIHKNDIPPELEKSIRDILENDMASSLQYIESSAKKMDSLLKGLLTLSRLGRVVLNIKNLNMNQMFEDIRKTLQFQLRENNIKLVIENLPPCKGDPEQINQVFSNLVDNAIKYRDPDRDTIIRISGERQYGFIIYKVEDNGIGIMESHQEKIFEIFHRLNPKGSIEGEGLGLPIVRRIIDRHSGTISVKSQEGMGSCFYVSLPEAD